MSFPTQSQSTPPPSYFTALGPLGSILTTAVIAAGAAGSGWLAHQGYIEGADQAQVSGLITGVLVVLVLEIGRAHV